MEHLRSVNKIDGNFILVIVLFDNMIDDLKYMEDLGFIPFDIQDKDNVFGKNEFHIMFINKNHELNKVVQQKLY